MWIFISTEIRVFISIEGLGSVKFHRHGLTINLNITVQSAFRHRKCAKR